jgi:hypothetical protein
MLCVRLGLRGLHFLGTYSHTDIFFSCIFYVHSSLNACCAMKEIIRIETQSTCAITPCFTGFKQLTSFLLNQSQHRKSEFLYEPFNKVTLFPPNLATGIAQSEQGLVRGWTEIEFRWTRDFPCPYRLTLRPTQSPLQWMSGPSRG